MSRYIVRCPDGNHSGLSILGQSHTQFLNGRIRLHDVFNKHKSKIDQIILKYINKVILGYLLGILLVLWYAEVSWGKSLGYSYLDKTYTHVLNILMVTFRFYDTFNENKPNLI